MKKHNFLICLFVYLFICLFFMLPEKIHASEFYLDVYPPLIRINTTAPANPRAPITIQNTSEQTQTFDILVKPFSVSKEQNGQVNYDNSLENIKDPLMFQRIKILDRENPINTIELAPKQKKELILNIDIPENKIESDYYFSILFVSKALSPDAQIKTNNSQILAGVGTNILLSIGNQGPQVKIDDFSTSFLNEKGPVEFTVKTSNNGIHFASAKGQIIIKNMFGQYIGKIDLTLSNILAGSTRFIPSDNQITKALWPEKFILGPYEATLSLYYSNDRPPLTRSTHFIGAPVQVFIAIIIILSLILIIRKRVKHRLDK